MICEIFFIVIGTSLLCLVGEPARAIILIEFGTAGHRHYGKLTVIIYPRARLMGLLETTYLVGVICVLPAITHFSGNRGPEVHAPRTCYHRISVAGRQFE